MTKRRIAVIIVTLLIVAAGVVLWLRARSGSGPAQDGMQTAEVARGTVALTVSGDGVLEPLTTVAVKSYAGGRVDLLAVDVGDVVQPGDLIAKIDPTDSLTTYDQARADLEFAQAGLRRAREQARVQPTLTQTAIAQAQAGYTAAAKDLDRLQQATHPQAQAEAQASLEKAKANLDIAEKELARAQNLKAQGFVPQSDVDTALHTRDLAKAELASVQRRSDTLEQEQAAELDAARAQVEQAQASLDKARADAVEDELVLTDVTSARAGVTRAQAEVTNASTMLDYTTITAPRAGVILDKYVEEGTIVTSGRSSVSEGTDIVLLGDLSRMFVEVSLDEADVAAVRAGQSAEITVDALPDQVYRGKVTRVNPQAVTEQNITTVLITVEIEDPDADLKPGMTASCDFLVEKVDDTLYLPSRAVQQQSGSAYVLLPQGESLVQAPVAVGLVGDDRTEILEGLKQGAQVVIPGLSGAAVEAEGDDRAEEMGRRMGGAGGFVR